MKIKKPKYRIVERSDSFYIQRRFLWSNCWYDLTTQEPTYEGTEVTLTLSFSSYKRASKYLQEVILNNVPERVLSYH